MQVTEKGELKEKYTYNSNKKLIEYLDNYAGLRYNEILSITTDEYYADNNRVGRTEYQYSGYTDTYTSAQDKFNRVVKETSHLGEVTFEYDDLGRVKSRTAYGKKETYGYMANASNGSYTTPLVNSLTYSDGTGLKYTYNSNGNIVRIDDQSGKNTTRTENVCF